MDQKLFVNLLEPGSEGIALIDKPIGLSSHTVVSVVRRVTSQKRVGHAGTLDPLATGLLIVLIGKKWTKRQVEFMKLDKSYIVEMQLGYESETYDTEAELVQKASWEKLASISDEAIKEAVQTFVGVSKQTVPVYSAVKVKGKKLYEMARKGKEIAKEDLPSREVSIYSISDVNVQKNESECILKISFEVRCSSGTYIRSLVHDLGVMLGVGAVMTALQRTSIGPYKLQNALTIKKYLK